MNELLCIFCVKISTPLPENRLQSYLVKKNLDNKYMHQTKRLWSDDNILLYYTFAKHLYFFV